MNMAFFFHLIGKWKIAEWGKNYEQCLSCVSIYESGAFWKWYKYQQRERGHQKKRANKRTNERTEKKGSIKGVFIHKRYRHCFVFHISSYLIFICHFVICVALLPFKQFFFSFYFSLERITDTCVLCALCTCVCLFACLYAVSTKIVNYFEVKNAAHSNNESSTE